MAKDEIRSKVPGVRSFDVVHFMEDTLQTWTDSVIRHPIRYTLDFSYNDSAGTLQKKTGTVIFMPDGNSIIHSQITDVAQ